MGGKNSTQRQGASPRQNAAGRSTTPLQRPPRNMPPHLAGQYDNNNQRQRPAPPGNETSNGNTTGDGAPPTVNTLMQQPQQTDAPQQQRNRSSGATGPSGNSDNNNNDRGGVQEGQMVKMLATVEASTVSYTAETHVLTFFITSVCDALTYEIHTGVKEFVQGGSVFYMPNKPKLEPTKTEIRGSQENRKITIQLDVHSLEEKEKVFNKHYPKQMPCVIVLRYRTTELRKREEGRDNNTSKSRMDDEMQTVEHTEHTAVDLAEKPRRRVISQIVTAGGNAYAVENLYGADNEGATVSAGGNGAGAVMIGSTIEDEEDGLCVICLTNPKDTAVMPCRHMCMCKECGEQLLKHKPVCPVCRAPISTLLHMPSLSQKPGLANGTSAGS